MRIIGASLIAEPQEKSIWMAYHRATELTEGYETGEG